MRISPRILLALLLLFPLACAPAPDDMDEAPPVDLVAEEAAARTVIDQFTEIWMTEDMDLVSRIFDQSPDLVVIGTDMAEWWLGYDAFTASLLEQFEAYEDTDVQTRDQVVHVHPSGEIAWFKEIADWHVTVGGERVEVNDMRVTGVLEKKNGAWLIVQMHVSVPVSGQVVEY
jgi:ketosteroid isomerase-like protein